ncbi:MAG: hypothetical protein KAU38_15740, partial [Desulfobacterales bacterium]|nr:hypothetical protein [Desulfobacterales bacterium]
SFKYGSVGGAPGNRCFYPEADGKSHIAQHKHPAPPLISGIVQNKNIAKNEMRKTLIRSGE